MNSALAILLFTLSSGPAPQAESAHDWNARFAGKRGWIGGDGVVSAVLAADRVIWMFGDTLVGNVKDGGRPGSVLVNNSLALQTGRGKDASLRFVVGKAKDDKPAAVFTPKDGRGWFWPVAAVRIGDKLYLFLPQLEKTKEEGAFGFRQVGQWLAIVDNPDDAPESWRVRQEKLPFCEFGPQRERCWGAAVLRHQDSLYVYGYVEDGKGIGRRKLTVARVPASKVENFAAWRFRAKDGWSEQAADAVPLAGGLATECSVGVLPGGEFLLVYTENGLGDRIVGRRAATPDGPWSEPVLLYRCPEMAKDKGVFTYAGKAHFWAATDREVLVSYCVNTWDFWRLFRDESVYRPQFVRVRLAER